MGTDCDCVLKGQEKIYISNVYAISLKWAFQIQMQKIKIKNIKTTGILTKDSKHFPSTI